MTRLQNFQAVSLFEPQMWPNCEVMSWVMTVIVLGCHRCRTIALKIRTKPECFYLMPCLQIWQRWNNWISHPSCWRRSDDHNFMANKKVSRLFVTQLERWPLSCKKTALYKPWWNVNVRLSSPATNWPQENMRWFQSPSSRVLSSKAQPDTKQSRARREERIVHSTPRSVYCLSRW